MSTKNEKQVKVDHVVQPSRKRFPRRSTATNTGEKVSRCPATFLEYVLQPGQVVQIFVKNVSGNKESFVGYYDREHLDQLKADVSNYSGKAEGIYYSLHAVTPECLDRSKNCLLPVYKAKSAKNADIVKRRLFLVDIDPVRSGTISATNEEKAAASQTASRILRWLLAQGWPHPVIVDSGNGYHLIFLINLPVDDDGITRNCLRALAVKFDDEKAKVDSTVFDLTRISKLPGTMACKGEPSKERPHRISECRMLVKRLNEVPGQLLKQLAAESPMEPSTLKKAAPLITAKASSVVASPTVLKRACVYLAMLPPAIEGQNGHDQFFNAACRLIDDFGLTLEESLPLLREYNSRCVPPFEEVELLHKLESATEKVGSRGGPTRRCVQDVTTRVSKKQSAADAEFLGSVPDFGLVEKIGILISVSSFITRPADSWVWLWQCYSLLRSDFLIPDVLLRQLKWGGRFGKNWRVLLKKDCKFLKSKPDSDCTVRKCSFGGLGKPHRHYCWSTDKFGLLDPFQKQTGTQPGQPRYFELYAEHNRAKLREFRTKGVLFNAYWPALLFGSSKCVGWTARQQRLLAGVVHELTRSKHRRAGEYVTSEIFVGNVVAQANEKSHELVCPLLDSKGQYAVFAGNGRRKGLGYQICGKTGKGWLDRAGYPEIHRLPPQKRIEKFKTFLSDLETLSRDLGLIPAALGRNGWKGINEMLDCLLTGNGSDWLEACTLRIFVPADWQLHWRQFFSTKMGFRWIPSSPEDLGPCPDRAEDFEPNRITTVSQIEQLLKEQKWTRQQLADKIAAVTEKPCSRKRVQRHLRGKSSTREFFMAVEEIRKSL